jgi:hypothetical protein
MSKQETSNDWKRAKDKNDTDKHPENSLVTKNKDQSHDYGEDR